MKHVRFLGKMSEFLGKMSDFRKVYRSDMFPEKRTFFLVRKMCLEIYSWTPIHPQFDECKFDHALRHRTLTNPPPALMLKRIET